MDARGMKGSWEALVFYVNPEKTAEIRKLAADAQWFEDRMPWDAEVPEAGRHAASPPTPSTSSSRPATPGRSRRSASTCRTIRTIREKHGSKSVSLSNVNEAYDRSTSAEFRREFAWTPEEAARAEKWSSLASELTTNMHEVIGHASGKISEKLKGSPQTALKEQYSALEEARADLVALYFLPDPKLAELGIVEAKDQDRDRPGRVRRLHAQRARAAAAHPRGHADRGRPHAQPADDRPVADGQLEGDRRPRARRQDLLRDGRRQGVQEGVGRLLAEVQRIKAEGDYDAADKLFETYGVHFDATLRDEVVARVERLKMPSYTGFVQPRLEAVKSADGQITDVKISYPLDLTTQMLEYSGRRK